ncbi:MAG TPA: Tad domain-containing protein [Stellaceae bacterium]|nr:Tad domain-containing protein [Stellaceae bacterium]
MGRPSGLAVTVLEWDSRLRAAAAKLAARVRGMPLIEDRSGATAMIVGLGATMLVGFAGIGTEMGLWYFNHRNLQNAADSAAMSAETAIYQGSANWVTEAKATAARYGFVDGTGGVTVTVNKPPASGPNVGNADDVEVIVTEPQTRLFTAMFSNAAISQTARAVAQIQTNGNGCVVTLDKNKVEDLFQNGNTQLNLISCDLYVNSNAPDALDQVGNASISAHSVYVVGGITDTARTSLTTTAGTYTGIAPIADPYANVQQPTPGSCTSQTITGGNQTLSPGTFCNGMNFTGGNVTLSPGVYIVDGNQFQASGNANISGDGVTIFLTGSGNNYANMQITGNASLNITPPTTGDTQGIGIFQDRNAPAPTCPIDSQCPLQNNIGGNGAVVAGVVYFPNESVMWNGNGATATPSCAQIVALTLKFAGNANFQTNCSGTPGVVKIGAIPARLVE